MRPLGETCDTFDIGGDLTVHRLGFGAMRITGSGVLGPPDDSAEARRVLARVAELGVDLVDTADSYGPGTSERLLGESTTPDEAVVATKGGLLRTPDGDWLRHGDPDYLRNAALCSRDRLGVDTIDLYQYHAPDPDVPIEESMHALAELKDRGVVRHVGVSNVSVDQLERARDVVDVATVQNEYSVADRTHDDVLAACEDADIGFLPYFPLGGGDLKSRGDTLATVADAHDATIRQVALAWLLERSPVVLPIPGTSSVDHLEANVAAAELTLTDEEMARLST
ncbi:aldo/keto reductase [Haloplanus pelagicus]|jgi:aryl-alcohol dehydrogenase-like predicted oxidoreductase|uniref:aldo/keto reductase n=1 Tax=Haloplanus pelagicus TaxID=2949995 RepID=UPI00203A7B41|nr:aldo/keto reductase [Haloplanus sp. HW8-1]